MNSLIKKFALVWINVLVIIAFFIFLKPKLLISVFLGTFLGGISVILFGNKYD